MWIWKLNLLDLEEGGNIKIESYFKFDRVECARLNLAHFIHSHEWKSLRIVDVDVLFLTEYDPRPQGCLEV
jgi:hypothetical protein